MLTGVNRWGACFILSSLLLLSGCGSTKQTASTQTSGNGLARSIAGGSYIQTSGTRTAATSVTSVSPAADAAGATSGSVVNALTGDPIASAVVRAYSASTSPTLLTQTTANTSGNYSLTGLPAGRILIMATAPGTVEANIGIVTSASTVNFGIFPYAIPSQSPKTINVRITGSSGQAVPDALAIESGSPQGGGYQNSSSASPRFSESRALTSVYFSAYSSREGAAISDSVDLTMGATTREVNLTIGADQGTISGMVALPASLTNSPITASVTIPYNSASVWFSPSPGYSTSYSNQFTLKLPPTGSARYPSYLLAVVTYSTTGSSAILQPSVSLAAGETQTRNLTLHDVPTITAPSANTTLASRNARVTWNAPSDFSPDFYLVSYFASGYQRNWSALIFLTDRDITIPVGGTGAYRVTVTGLETPGADINNLDFRNLDLRSYVQSGVNITVP